MRLKNYFVLPAVLSGILLVLSFPPFEWWFLGWVALVPLLIASLQVSPRWAALLGWICGFVASLGIGSWLGYAAWWAPFFFAAYCPLFFIPVCVFISLFRHNGFLQKTGLMIGATAVWVASEYLRAHTFTGFPWNLLGVSQYKQLSLIQIADWGGVYAVSAMMFFMNMAVAVTLHRFFFAKQKAGKWIPYELVCALFLVALTCLYGESRLRNRKEAGHPVRVALIQPNRPTGIGSAPVADKQIHERLESLTDAALKESEQLDLIVWPELALPECARVHRPSAELIKRTVKKGVHLLAGMPDHIWPDGPKPDSFNSSILFSPQGELLQTYHKQHRVLFAEYAPFTERLPSLKSLMPGGSVFSAGKESILFRLPGNPYPFSVLICFEDTFPKLARNAVRNGATWLVNQTDDSWVDPSCGSRQQLANAIFRCIENRMPMVCCANTGITCSIDRYGGITQTLSPRIAGFQIAEIFPGNSGSKTFYTRHGNLFVHICLTIALAGFSLPAMPKIRRHTRMQS